MDFSKISSIVSSIHKKGDRLVRANYRAISLLSMPGKIFLRILSERMEEKVKTKYSESQYGFRPGRGTQLMLFSLFAK